MIGLIDYFIKRPLLVNLFTVMILIFGGVTVWGLQKEIFPLVDFDVIMVRASYPGSSSEDVEKLVTIGLERKLKEVDGIKEMNGLSAEGSSIITIEVDPDYELEKVLDDVKNSVDSVDDLPDDVTVPTVPSLNNRQRAIIKLSLTGIEYDGLRKASKKLRDELEKISSIAKVDLDGYRVDEIRIELSPKKMARFEVTIGEVARAIKERNLNLSAGKLETPNGDIIVRTISEFKNTAEIEDVVVRSNTSGSKIKIRDIAKVIRKPREGSILQRSNGERAVFLDIKLKETGDVLNTTRLLKTKTAEWFEKNSKRYQGLKYRYADDMSYFVKRRLNILKNNGLVGMVLVFICLLFFLNFSTSVVTSMGAPIAFMVSFIVMDSMGLSLNLISMFALILVLGMLVDDSIIVSEHFYQKLEGGMDPKVAAREAAIETIKPVTATVLTTIVAFGTLLFMGGIMGKFLWPVPVMVIICLLASLFECFFILPSHLADFCRVSPKQKGSRWYQRLLDLYSKSLDLFLKGPWLVLGASFIFLVGSVFLAKTMRFELFPGDDVRVVFLQIKGKVGTPLIKTDTTMKRLEKMAMETVRKDELDQIKGQVGVLLSRQSRKTGHHYGSLIVYLTPPGERERSTDDILNELTDKAKPLAPGYVITVRKMQGGPPRGNPVEVEITGGDLEQLKKASKEVLEIVKDIPGIKNPEIDFEEGKEQLAIIVNDAEARRLGLTTFKIATEIRRALSGDELTEIRESDEDIEIKLFFNKESQRNINSLNLLSILNDQGRQIPLKRVVKFESQPGAFIIRRLNRKRIISVIASIHKKKTTPVAVAKALKPQLAPIIEKYPEVDFTMAGENKDTKDSMFRLAKSGMLALFCIFLILVVMFGSLVHPMIIMSAIPLGLIGVIIAFKFFGATLGFMAFMGVVGLVGVVVNDSIVLVTFINKKREEGLGLLTAIKEGCRSRFRAVILTTFTTVAGLMPIAHQKVSYYLSLGFNTDNDPFLQPMALAFAWGLLFASLVTLIFIPCNYLAVERSKVFFKRMLGKCRSKVGSGHGSEKTGTSGA